MPLAACRPAAAAPQTALTSYIGASKKLSRAQQAVEWTTLGVHGADALEKLLQIPADVPGHQDLGHDAVEQANDKFEVHGVGDLAFPYVLARAREA